MDVFSGKHVELHKLCHLLQESGADAARHVIEKKLARSPCALHYAAEHPKGEHVEEKMAQAGVHEHVGDKLIQPEVGSKEEMKTEKVVKPSRMDTKHHADKVSQHVNY